MDRTQEIQDPFQPGELVEGRYRVEKKLDEGGSGTVYEAVHDFTGLRVALKALKNRAGDHPERMAAEARTLAEMRHPNIVQITDGGVYREIVWFTMELLEGRSLRSVLNTRVPLGIERALRFGIQIAEGVAVAHALGVIHRDLKPENVFVLRGDEGIKVLDFGTSKLDRNTKKSLALKTTDRFRLIGTKEYMAPERLKAEKADARTDIYGEGLILYEMISGRHCWSDGPGPLDLPDGLELCMRQVFAPPKPLRVHVPDLPREIDEIVLRALAKDPRHRQQSMRQLSDELREALDQWLGSARREPPREILVTAPHAQAALPIKEPRAPTAVSKTVTQRIVVPPSSSDGFTTTTEESVAPFSAPGPSSAKAVTAPSGVPLIQRTEGTAPKAAPTPSTSPVSGDFTIEGSLVCGAARFASSSPELTPVELGLRAFAELDASDETCGGLTKELVRLADARDERNRTEWRTVVARVGRTDASNRSVEAYRVRNLLAMKGWTPGARHPSDLSRTELVRGASMLLDPDRRLDSAETALARLVDADSDVQSLALAVLVAFARTPLDTHPAPRGALLALLLGGQEDSELARTDLAGFVLSGAAAVDLSPAEGPAVELVRPPPDDVRASVPEISDPSAAPAELRASTPSIHDLPTRSSRSPGVPVQGPKPELAHTPTPGGIATPRPPAPHAPKARTPERARQMMMVIGISAACAAMVFLVFQVLRRPAPSPREAANKPTASSASAMAMASAAPTETATTPAVSAVPPEAVPTEPAASAPAPSQPVTARPASPAPAATAKPAESAKPFAPVFAEEPPASKPKKAKLPGSGL
jgi:serine/threonine protein kinase